MMTQTNHQQMMMNPQQQLEMKMPQSMIPHMNQMAQMNPVNQMVMPLMMLPPSMQMQMQQQGLGGGQGLGLGQGHLPNARQ